MAQGVFIAPECGCIWRGTKHDHACVMWSWDVERLERLRTDPRANPATMGKAREKVYAHMPPSMVGEDLT